MEVKVSLSGMIASNSGFKEKAFTFEKPVTVGNVLNMLEIRVKRNWLLVSVNNVIVKDFVYLKDSDVLKIIPICGGG